MAGSRRLSRQRKSSLRRRSSHRRRSSQRGGRRKPLTCEQKKMKKVMEEYKKGSLRTSAGRSPTSRKQAIAIGMSESARYC